MSALLTESELADLTGYARPSYQVKWLKAGKWQFTTDRHGCPKVARAYFDIRMGITQPTETKQNWKPDFSKMPAGVN